MLALTCPALGTYGLGLLTLICPALGTYGLYRRSLGAAARLRLALCSGSLTWLTLGAVSALHGPGTCVSHGL